MRTSELDRQRKEPSELHLDSLSKVEILRHHSDEDYQQQALNLSQALRKCLAIRLKIEQHPFGYFFQYPVNPYKLKKKDYWRVVRRPMDLSTIRSKLLTNIYTTHDQFDSDMRLMFANALNYNQKQPHILKEVQALLSSFSHTYNQFKIKILKGEIQTQPASKRRKTVSRDPALEQVLSEAFTPQRKQQLGSMLQFLLISNQKKLLRVLQKKHQDICISSVEGKRAILLDGLTAQQLMSMLKLGKGMKVTDFDIGQLVSVEVDPLLEGYNEHHDNWNQGQESSFEVDLDEQ